MISSGNKIIDLYRRHQREFTNHLSRSGIVSTSNQNSTVGAEHFSRSKSNEDIVMDLSALKKIAPMGRFATDDSMEMT